MATTIRFKFDTIAPGQTGSVFLHSYEDNEAVFYTAIPFNQPALGVLTPEARVTLTQGETIRWHVNGKIGRSIYVRNHDHISSVGVRILQTKESF